MLLIALFLFINGKHLSFLFPVFGYLSCRIRLILIIARIYSKYRSHQKYHEEYQNKNNKN
jgi:hypothetical protein